MDYFGILQPVRRVPNCSYLITPVIDTGFVVYLFSQSVYHFRWGPLDSLQHISEVAIYLRNHHTHY